MKVKIGAFSWDLQEVPTVINKDGINCFGLTHFASLKMEVETDLGKAHKLNTYIHEVLEGINYTYGYELDHGQVVGIASCFAQVMQENFALVEKIQELCKLEHISYSPVALKRKVKRPAKPPSVDKQLIEKAVKAVKEERR